MILSSHFLRSKEKIKFSSKKRGSSTLKSLNTVCTANLYLYLFLLIAYLFCKGKPNGQYQNPLDIFDSTYYWCTWVGSWCMRCPAGTSFCPLDYGGPPVGHCIFSNH